MRKRLRFASVLTLATLSLCGCSPSDPLQEVREAQAKRQFERSLEPLKELVATRPDDPEVHYRYGVALNRTGTPELAVWSLRKAALDEAWAIPARLELATSALQARDYTSALEATSEILEEHPDDPQALFLRAEAYISEKQSPDLALEDLDRLLELVPDQMAAKSSRVAALIMLERIDEAEQALVDMEKALAEGDETGESRGVARICVTRAMLEEDKGNFDEAEKLFESCLERLPSQTVVLQEATRFFDAQGKPTRANEALKKALSLQPQATHYRTALAERLRVFGSIEEAEALLREGLSIGNDLQKGALWLALKAHYEAREELDPAIGALAEYLALTPKAPVGAHLEYADLLARAKRYDDARAVASSFENETYKSLIEARVHYDQDRPAEALAELESVFLTWPNNAGARYYAARAAEQMGDFPRAIEEYRQSIRSGPGDTEAGLRLGKILRAQGQIEAAVTAANHYLGAGPSDVDAVTFLVYTVARAGHPDQLRALLERLRGSKHYPTALAIQAEVAATRVGAENAVARLQSAAGLGLDLSDPRSAPLLRVLVDHLGALDRHEEAQQLLQKALEAHPDAPDLFDIQGMALERQGAPEAEVRAAYERAIELDPKHRSALEGLGRRMEAAADVEGALQLLDRATEAAPAHPRAARRAAQLASEHRSAEEAEKRWHAFLKEHPWDGRGALALAELRFARGDDSDQTVELARRALRFGRVAEAADLLAKVYDARGDPERAAEARARRAELDSSDETAPQAANLTGESASADPSKAQPAPATQAGDPRN